MVQVLVELQSASALHWMQPPLLGSHVSPVPQAVLFGVFEHLPAEQVSVVQAIKSSQSESLQQVVLQPTPAQHLPPLAHTANEQLPFTHLPD